MKHPIIDSLPPAQSLSRKPTMSIIAIAAMTVAAQRAYAVDDWQYFTYENECGNIVNCSCHSYCDETDASQCYVAWDGDDECVTANGGSPGYHAGSKESCPKGNSASYLLLTRFEHMHDALDYQPAPCQPQPSVGCAPCAASAGGSKPLPKSTQMPQVTVSRLHRYRNQTMRSGFGKGVYGWWDKWLILNRRNPDGSGALELQTPDMTGQSTTFSVDYDHPGCYRPAHGKISSAKLFGADGQLVVDQRLAVRAVVQDSIGNQMEFEIVNFSNDANNSRRDGRLIAYRDARGHGVRLDYAYPADATTTAMGNDRNRLCRIAKATDPYGNHLDFTWSAKNRIETIATPTGGVIGYQYDANGYLTLVNQADGATTTVAFSVSVPESLQVVTYDDPTAVDAAMHRHKRIWLATPTWIDPTNPMNQVAQTANTIRRLDNGAGNRYETSFQMFANRFNSIDWQDVLFYRGGNQLTRNMITNHAGLELVGYAFGYQPGATSFNNLTFEYESLAYIQSDSQPLNWKNGVGQTIKRTLAPNGESGTFVFPDGTEESYEYNDRRQVTRHVLKQNNKERKTVFEYDDWGNLTKQIQAADSPVARTFTWKYDPQTHLLTQEIDPRGNVTDYTYDDTGRVAAVIQPPDSTGDLRATTNMYYDAAGRISQVTDPNGKNRVLTWDISNRLAKQAYADSSSESWTYATTGVDAGLLTVAKDRNGNITHNYYDEMGRKVQVVRAEGTPEAQVSAWQYLPGTDLVAKETVSGNSTEFLYDHRNRLTERRQTPRVGTVLVERYFYDELGRQFLKTDAYGRSEAQSYDAGGRVTRRVQELLPSSTLSMDMARAIWDRDHPAPTIDPAWTNANVGFAYPPGSAQVDDSGVVTITGNGMEMWGAEDAFFLRSQNIPEGGVVTARLTSLEHVHDWSKAGVMIRGSASSRSAYAAILWSPVYGLCLNVRTFEGAQSRYLDLKMRPLAPNYSGPQLPITMRATRSGNLVRFSYSSDEVTWNNIPEIMLDLPADPVLGGIFVLSHTAQTCVATFDRVGVEQVRYQPSQAEVYRWMLPTLSRTSQSNAVISDTIFGFLDELAARVDGRGNTTQYEYDDLGQNTAVTEAVGTDDAATIRFSYDEAGNRVRQESPRGIVTVSTFTGRNLLSSVTEAVGTEEETRVLNRTYSATRKPLVDTDALGRSTVNTYGTCCDRLTKVTDAAGFDTIFTYDFNGNRLSTTDPNNLTSSFAYDPLNRIKSSANAAGQMVHYEYDDNLTDGVGIDEDPRVARHLADLRFSVGASVGSAVKITDPTLNSSIEIRDGLGRNLLHIDPLGHTTWTLNDSVSASGLVEVRTVDALQHTTTARLDGAGRVREQVDASGQVTRLDYDANGNRIRQRDPNGVGADLVYDARNRLIASTDTASHTTQRQYDLDGNLLSTTDALNGIERNVYDLRNRKLSTTDRINATTTFTYDAVGNLLTISDADNAGRTGPAFLKGRTEYGYDARNLLVTETFPQGQDGRTRRAYGYDAGRRLVSRQVGIADATPVGFQRAPEATAYAYDRANRLITRGYADGADDAFAYDPAGRLVQATSARYGNQVGRFYDAAGRLLQETLSLDMASGPQALPPVFTVRYGYDDDNRTVAITYPSGQTVRRTYTARNQLETVSFPGIAARRSYDDGGRLVETVSGNLKTETRTYVPGENLVAQIAVPGVTGFTYTYDALERKLAENDTLQPQASQSFAYDAQSRLTAWNTPRQNQSWNLSPVGDWRQTTIDGVTQNRDHTSVHEIQAIDGQRLGWDFKGNLTRDEQGQILLWDQENRLKSAWNVGGSLLGRATYAYDALGRRVAKTVDRKTTVFACAGAQVVEEIELPQAPTRAEARSDGSLANLDQAPMGLAGASGAVLAGTPWKNARQGGLLRINFQPETSVIPDGFLADKGRTLARRSNGLTYGWSEDRTAEARQRNRLEQGQVDTFIPLGGSNWRIALPNGSYPVALVAGDAETTEMTNHLLVNGQTLTDTDPTPPPQGYRAGDFDGWAFVAQVTDGFLTISAAPSAVDPKLCYIEIGAKGSALPTQAASALATLVEGFSEVTAGSGFPPGVMQRKAFVYGSYVDEVLAVVSTVVGQTKVNYVHSNHLYSVAALTDMAGQVVERYTYDAYGKQKITSATGVVRAKSSVGWDRGFTGYIADNETGLYCSRARMYSPILGGFANRDPWMERPLCFQNTREYSDYDLDELWNSVSGGSVYSQLALLADLGRKYGWKNEGGTCGMQPRARDGYQDGLSLYRPYFVPNKVDPFGLACGSGDIGDALIPDRPFGFDFTPCCEAHDLCYETCGRSKEDCDNEFYQCMLDVVQRTGSNRFTRWWGRRLAGIYYQAVKSFGNGAYCDAQKAANCCPLPDNCK